MTSLKKSVPLWATKPATCSTTTATTIPSSLLHLPGPDFMDTVVLDANRSTAGGAQLAATLQLGQAWPARATSRFSRSNQGIEHSAGASFAANPIYFDPENIVKLAIAGGCNARRLDLRALNSVARKYAHKIPFIVKLNHNELMTFPNKFDRSCSAKSSKPGRWVRVAVGATIYFGSPESSRQIVEVAKAFRRAHELGMATILWCYLRNNGFKKGDNGLPRRRRSDRPGQPPRRHDRSRHHQAEAAGSA